jgi:6-phosphogluconate dehydrogenase
MQLICEAFDLLKRGLHLSAAELHQIFAKWNQGRLKSYLIEITSHIFQNPILDKILDVAGQKGTGKWTAIDALDRGIPVTLIGEAVFARCLSSLKEERVKAHQLYPDAKASLKLNAKEFIDQVELALYASKIISYAQGFSLMKNASEEHGWKLRFGSIALMWRGGCIIRSQFLGNIKDAFERKSDLQSLLLDPFFEKAIHDALPSWRAVISQGVLMGIPLPAFSSALAFFDGYRSERLPAYLLQAQRDYFGAHTYERIDQPRGKFFHTEWNQ